MAQKVPVFIKREGLLVIFVYSKVTTGLFHTRRIHSIERAWFALEFTPEEQKESALLFIDSCQKPNSTKLIENYVDQLESKRYRLQR